MSPEKLSPRLEANLDALFDAPRDLFTLYWKIAADMEPGALAAAQKRIRRILQRKGEIGADSAVLLACVLHLTGFPASRIMHFLSLYLRGGISLSQFDFAVGVIFLDGVPVPEPLVYDMSRYTYLEKRLLARKSLEISARLKDSVGPGVLLYLYLLSLREDLSNENVQLIGLVMKHCFPALDVRTRLGGASLDEYGDLARAWKKAEQRSLAVEAAASGAERRPARVFDRETASAFLDKYFSDAALAEVRAAAPAPVRKTPRPVPRREPPARPLAQDVPVKQSSPRPARAVAAPATLESTSASGPEQPVLQLRDPARVAAAAPAAPPRARRASRPLPVIPALDRNGVGPRARVAQDAPPETQEGHGDARKRPPAMPRERARRLARPASSSLFPFAPVALAAILCFCALILVRPHSWSFPAGVVPAAIPPATAAEAPAPPLSAPDATPSTTPYVVRPGDSLWKIFVSQGGGAGSTKGWSDFLSSARALNQLGDPNTIRPGRVLTIAAPHK